MIVNKGVFKKATSCVLGILSCSRTAVHAPRANNGRALAGRSRQFTALLVLAAPKQLRAGGRPF